MTYTYRATARDRELFAKHARYYVLRKVCICGGLGWDTPPETLQERVRSSVFCGPWTHRCVLRDECNRTPRIPRIETHVHGAPGRGVVQPSRLYLHYLPVKVP